MLRRAILATTFAIAAVAGTVTPAQSIELPPPGGALHVIRFYSDSNLFFHVGTRTFGCPNQPKVEKGMLDTPYWTHNLAPCA